MDLFTYLSSLGLVPSVSTRPGTSLFMVSLAITFGVVIGPAWLFGVFPLFVLFLIVLIEWNIWKEAALLEIIETAMPFIKAILAVMITIVMFNNSEAGAVLELMGGEQTVSSPWWVTAANWLWSLLLGVLTWYTALYRQSFLFFLTEFDEDNDLGLLSLYSWMEVFFTATSTLLALVVPVAAILLFIVTALGLRGLRHYLEKQEEKKRQACPNNCGTQIYGSALNCPNCQAKNPTPLKVGLLGQTTSNYVKNKNDQYWALLSQKRCPRCATRFHGRTLNQVCSACQEEVLNSPKMVQAYAEHFDAKLPRTLLISGVVGLIPFVGLVFGVVYYRLTLVSPMRRYVPTVQGCIGRWGTRLINLFLISFQPIPFFGALMLPVMCYINFKMYRSLFIQSQFHAIQPIEKHEQRSDFIEDE